MQEMNPASPIFQRIFSNPFPYVAFKSTVRRHGGWECLGRGWQLLSGGEEAVVVLQGGSAALQRERDVVGQCYASFGPRLPARPACSSQ